MNSFLYNPRMTTDIQKTALRLPRDLHQKIHESADKNGRSMNAEIIHRLENSFSPTSDATMAELQALAREAEIELHARMQRLNDIRQMIEFQKKSNNQ